MSTKWRAVQHRHRYTYNSVIFPKPYTDILDLLPPETFSASDFFSKLKDFVSLNSTYSQISAAKGLSSSFTQLLNSPHVEEGVIFTSIRFYLEILFLENSLPLHRTLIAALTKIKKFLPLICDCFVDLSKKYSDLAENGIGRFLVSRAALSLISYPKTGFLNEALKKCSVLAVSDIVLGLTSVLLDVDRGSRPSPLVMEQCQDAMSCLYYLLQKFPQRLSAIEESFCTFERIIGIILSVLKSSTFSRDCLVAAGVSFCAAVQSRVRGEDLPRFLSKAVFDFCGEDGDMVELAENLCVQVKGFSNLSRLCLLRGMLTSVSRNVLNIRFDLANGSSRTLLYNAIFLELCGYCENPIDSHFNFHSLTVLQICLQQIKTSILTDLINASVYYDHLHEEMTSRLLRIVWNNLEDSLSQTVKQVHLIFDLLLDIKSSIPLKNDDGTQFRNFMQNIASDLILLGSRCKGKYVPLTSLGKRLGSSSLLKLNPNILFDAINGYSDDDVCCAITSFLKSFLECLRDECWNRYGIEDGYEAFRKSCLPPLLQGLLSGTSKLRTNLNTYAFPTLLDVDPDSIFSMISYISTEIYPEKSVFHVDLKADSRVTAFVSLLKVSRTLALIEGDIDLDSDDPNNSKGVAFVRLKGTKVKVFIEWLILALTHTDESLRIDAAEFLFLNPKTASLPSSLEISLMRKSIPLNMRCSSTSFQMKWTCLFRKFFSRARTALERQVKQGLWQPNGDGYTSSAEDLFKFMKWLSCFLFCSCYPSAPYERKTMAMQLILAMMDVWPLKGSQDGNSLYPYSKGFTSSDSILLFIGSIIDSWDRLRESSFRILVHFPTPLPGIYHPDTLSTIIYWAKRLVCSPRVRESDAGALTFRLMFRKYVVELGWEIGHFISDYQTDIRSGEMLPVAAYISALLEWLRAVIQEGERDLFEACRKSFAHGVLLTLRYTFEDLDWNSKEVMSSGTEIRRLLQNLLELIMRVTSLTLWVVSADGFYMSDDMDDVIEEDNFISDSFLEHSLEQDCNAKRFDDKDKAAEHVVMVGCWLAMKEASLLLGAIIRKVPLPSYPLNKSSKYDYHAIIGDESCVFVAEDLLDLQQLESIGSHFLQVLLKMKHNGAIDKTRAGFTALCNRLLCSNDPRLCKMTETWMGQLMERTIAKGQTVDDLLRRSAGIPAAFTAFFLSEPEGTPKTLLPKAITWLINTTKTLCKDHNPEISIKNENGANGSPSKSRDEGVIPTVHAFNSLRASFNDANLAADTSGFCAEALIVAIRSFSSPYWEVRNSACLAYTSLVRRMIGFLNVHKRESSRRVLSGLEFFHRYPALHPFLCTELEIATKQIGDEQSMAADLNTTKPVHPSLCPILILLSRLKPSLINISTDDLLDPFMLIPFVRKCGTQSNLRLRVLAARALIGLVANEKLHSVLSHTTLGLPLERRPSKGTNPSFNFIHGILLQLSYLLNHNCRNLSDDATKDRILGEIIDALTLRSWIGSFKSCPCPMLNGSFLLVLDQMNSIALSYPSKHSDLIRILLLALSSECLDENNYSGHPFYDSTVVDLRKQAAASYFSCLFGTKKEAFCKCAFNLSKIVTCITDSMYEVRIITLKKLLQLVLCLNSDGIDAELSAIQIWVKRDLQTVLMQLLPKEANPKCIYYVLKIVFSCSFFRSDEFMDQNTALNFWDTLVRLRDTVRRAKTGEIILCCMAICTKQFTKMIQSLSYTQGEIPKIFDCINSFVILTKQLSAPSSPVNTRRSAAVAIVASGLLEEAIFVASHVTNESSSIVEEEEIQVNMPNFMNLYCSKIVDLWFTCIQLLEDEDATLRQKLAEDVQKHVGFRHLDAAVQVDRVIELIFEFLSKIFSGWVEYIQFLLRHVFMAASSASFQGDLVRKIFEKEIDNHHEEKLLICQICCFHLENLFFTKLGDFNEENLAKLLQKWRNKFLHQLISFAEGFLATEGNKDWIGGIGNHKDAFVSLYALLLGLYVLSKPSEGLIYHDEMYLLKFLKFKEIVRPFLQNSLILNLYLIVIRLNERLEPNEYSSTWEEFNPFFLLQ